jgi:thioredoxin reductase
VHTGQTVTWAKEDDGTVRLGVTSADGSSREVVADHLITGTGYRADLARFSFLGDDLRARLRMLGGSSVVGGDYQSSVPGLFFIGPAVAPTMGPVMRFVFGSAHAAKAVARSLGGPAGQRSPAAAVPAAR